MTMAVENKEINKQTAPTAPTGVTATIEICEKTVKGADGESYIEVSKFKEGKLVSSKRLAVLTLAEAEYAQEIIEELEQEKNLMFPFLLDVVKFPKVKRIVYYIKQFFSNLKNNLTKIK